MDFEKEFDRVNWIKMMEVLKQLQVDWRDRRLICDLCMPQEAVIIAADGESEKGLSGRNVQQGCPLSSLLLEAMQGISEGVRAGVNMLRM